MAELLTSPEAVNDALRQVREKRASLHLERTRQNIDAIRARCQTFPEFVKEAWPVIEPATPLVWNWHLLAMCLHLEAISRGQLYPRLIINIPPGCSKSTIVSVLWQAWEWGPLGKPGLKFLSTSYEMGNVARDTRKTRDLIMSEWYQSLWPEVVLTRQGEASFENTSKGFREGVAFKSLTAKRGDRLTIDDPHSLDGAESEVERTKSVQRFIEGGQNRLNDQEKSAVVVVMQRLHERDLTGELLARELGYIHLNLPMEFEPERKCITPLFEDPRTFDGELLDPRRFPQAVLDLLKKDNDYMWAGQYQQRPAPRGGGMFKIPEDWSTMLVDHAPAGLVRVRGWDIAGSTAKRSPFTAGAGIGYDRGSGLLYIWDMQRVRKEIADAERHMVGTAFDDGLKVKQSFPQDPGSAGKSQKHHLSAKLAGLDFIFSTETGEKADRAIPVASQWNAGMFRMVRGPWNTAFIEELRNFPAGAYKDQVDALSRAYGEIAKVIGVRKKGFGAPIIVEDAA